MILEFDLNEESADLHIVLDNALKLTASKDGKSIIYSRNFSKIDDDDVILAIKKMSEILLEL